MGYRSGYHFENDAHLLETRMETGNLVRAEAGANLTANPDKT